MAASFKTKFVMDRDPLSGVYVFRDDGNSNIVIRQLSLDPTVVQDLGTPNQITITIRPGDRLN